MMRVGWCSSNTNLATKIWKFGRGKQLNYCHAPYAVLKVKSGAMAMTMEIKKMVQHYGESSRAGNWAGKTQKD